MSFNVPNGVDDTFPHGMQLFFEFVNQRLDSIDPGSVRKALTAAPLHLIPDLEQPISELLHEAYRCGTVNSELSVNLVPFAIARSFKYARYAHHAAGVLRAVLQVGHTVNWLAVYNAMELYNSATAVYASDFASVDEYSPDTPLSQILTDALVVLSALYEKGFPSKWKEESFSEGKGFRFTPRYDDPPTRITTLRTKAFFRQGGFTSWSLFTDNSSAYLLALCQNPGCFPPEVVQLWFAANSGQAHQPQEQEDTNQKLASLLSIHTKGVTVNEFISDVRLYHSDSRPSWLFDILAALHWKDFLRAVLLTDSVTYCHMTCLPLPKNYPSQVVAPVKDLYISLVLQSQCKALRRNDITERFTFLRCMFRGTTDSCLQCFLKDENILGPATVSTTQTSPAGFQFHICKWETQEWVIPVHGAWRVQVSSTDDNNSKRVKLLNLVNAYMTFLLEHRPWLMSKEEAAELLDTIGRTTDEQLSRFYNRLGEYY